MSARHVFEQSEAAVTRRYLAELSAAADDCGVVAAQLFRAQKASTRAKHYRGGKTDRNGIFRSHRDLAYQNKGNALELLCQILMRHWPREKWGWGRDENAGPGLQNVLYVDLNTGQVSFHSSDRYEGPDYLRQWDGVRGVSADRIIEFCDQVMGVNALPLPF